MTAASLALYRSDDGWTFRYVTLVADARDYDWSYYGPGSENSIAVLADGKTLMVANRFDGNVRMDCQTFLGVLFLGPMHCALPFLVF